MKSVRAVFGAATAAALVLVVAACGSGAAQPNYSPVPTASTSTGSGSPSSPATPNTTINVPSGAVEPPAPAMADSSDSAFEFAVYYWQMLSWAYSTNDASVIDGLYADSCTSCASFRRNIADDVENDGVVLRGGQIRVTRTSLATPGPGELDADFAFDVSLAVAELVVRSADGEVLKTYPAQTDIQRTYVSWVEDHFEVVGTIKVKIK